MGKHYENDIWKPIGFCHGKYAVSRFGKVKSVYALSKHFKLTLTGTILKTTINYRGYEKVRLSWLVNGIRQTKTMAVHRLVAIMFIPNPKNMPEVNHKDLNKLNNNFKNLEWSTPKENTNHYYVTTGKSAKPYVKKGYAGTFKPIIDLNTGIFYNSDELSRLLGVKRRYLSRILREERKPNTTQYRYA